MVKTYSDSRFVLKSLEEIRNCPDVILQIEDTGVKFDSGNKCYLCEVIAPYRYRNEPNEKSLMSEICKLNEEKRKLERKIQRLEKELSRCKND